MTATVEQDFATISLEVACQHKSCADMAFPLYKQLDGGDYSWPMSVLPLDEHFNDYLARLTTARKRRARAERLGYLFEPFERFHYADDIHSINLSLPERQGRPMSAGYLAAPVYAVEEYPCERHRVNCYGVFKDDTLVAYTFVYRAGALALVSQILGHGQHLDDGIMFLLVTGAVEEELEQGGYLTYNRHDSGTSGLQWHKERLGFRPTKVEWSV